MDVVHGHATRPAGARGQIRPSATAEITCGQRAAETLNSADRRLIDDPFARLFLRDRSIKAQCANRAIARMSLAVFDRLYPGFMAIVLLRNRWYEEVLAEALRDGITQIVLLGSGFDTTALRLDLGSATLFDVDATPTQTVKRAVIREQQLTELAEVVYVPCDFERDDLVPVLCERGFDPTRRSLVVWFGVSYFLTADAVRKTMQEVAQLTAPGSRFLWDYLDGAVIDGTTPYAGARRARAEVDKRGEPYLHGVTRAGAEELTVARGFDVRSHLSITDLGARYGGERGVWCSTDDFAGVIVGERRPEAGS